MSRDREKDALTALQYAGALHKRYAGETRKIQTNRGVVDLTCSFIHSFIH